MTAEIRPLPVFEYVAPASLAEAIALLSRHGGAAKLLAGGTDLLPRMKRRRITPRIVVDLNGIPELAFIEPREGALHIGGGTRLAALYESASVREMAPALADAIRVMSSPGIRNRATIGGNLCNASRCADTPAPLLALDAGVKLRGPQGERTVAISDFFTARGNGRGKTVTGIDEVLTEVIIPLRPGSSAFLKLGRRQGSSTAIVSAAVFVLIRNRTFADVRVAVSAFGSTPVRGLKVESALKGMPADEETIARASALVKDEIDPISDQRASAAYRREMAPVMVRRALARAALGETSCW